MTGPTPESNRKPDEAAAKGAEAAPSANQTLSVNDVLKRPLLIPTAEGGSWLDIVRQGDRAAAVELLLDLCSRAPAQTVMRWAGGCKGFTPEMVEQLFAFLASGTVSADGKRCFQGAVGSGGTMQFDADGAESYMICQVPYFLARLHPCIAWGSTPQTYRLRLDEAKGNLIVSKYGNPLDHRGHGNVLTQHDATHFQGWDGDVRWYMEGLQTFARRGFKVAVGVVNGGDITIDEALLALSKGIPVVIVKGSGRAADQLADALPKGGDAVLDLYRQAFKRGLLDPDRDEIPDAAAVSALTHIVDLRRPEELSAAMDKLGLLTATATPADS